MSGQPAVAAGAVLWLVVGIGVGVAAARRHAAWSTGAVPC
jgi:hypothetical protein